MEALKRRAVAVITAILVLSVVQSTSFAQDDATILTDSDLTHVVPTSFYYDGQSASTQMRNAAAVRFGAKRYVVAGLVDTSGYSTEIQAAYLGFFITDSRVSVGGAELGPGAYGFGFSKDGKFNVFDLGGGSVASVAAANDKALARPRPLMMQKASDGVRLYAGRNYVVVAPK
jgi:hypothetical protein